MQKYAMGGLNDREHRYFGRVPDRVENVFSRPIRVGLDNPDAILGSEGFLVFEILKGDYQTRSSGRSEFLRPQFSTFFNFVSRIYSLRA